MAHTGSSIVDDHPVSRAHALASHRFLMRIALGAGNIFAWIFMFRGFFLMTASIDAALFAVALLYVVTQVIVFVLTPLSSGSLRHGMRRSLAYGTLIASFAFACLSLVFAPQIGSGEFAFGMIVTFVVLMGIHRALYWVPYRAEIADSGAYETQGRWREIVVALIPFIAGCIVAVDWLGPQALLAAVALCALCALVPLIRIPESYERFDWDFIGTFRALSSPTHRSLVKISILDGIQGVALLIAWPLAIFLILGQSFIGLGFILSLTLILTPIGRYFMRSALQLFKSERSTPVEAVIVFSGWIMRLAAASPVAILAADVYASSGSSPRTFSIDTALSDQIADASHYVDEYTALKEMGMACGRILACIVLAVLAVIVHAPGALALLILIAAFAAAWSVVISRRLSRGV